MSLEIKSIDIENEEEEKVITVFQSFGWNLKSSQRVFSQTSTPRGAVSYENLTYIHSEKETIDFTKLVFERDTKMPNYDEIIELEEEFWELSEKCPEGRPPAPELMNFEDWIKKSKPSAFSKSKKFLISFVFYLISGFLFGLLVYFIASSGDEEFATLLSFILSISISLLIIPIHLGISKVLFYWYNTHCLKHSDLNNNHILQQQYSKYVDSVKILQEDAVFYDNIVNKMRELLWKSKNLL